jgi:hypothetical protein
MIRNASRIGLAAILCGLVVIAGIGSAVAQSSVNAQSQQNVTVTDCSIALTTGGAAQTIIAASNTVHGFIIMNVDNTNGSGEPVWISFTGTAAAAAAGSYALPAPVATTYAFPGSFASPIGFGSNKNVSVVAATTGHVISCTRW